MTNDKGILIRNIYHMLAYAFTDLRHKHYEYIAKEEFEHIYDMFAEILFKGMSIQIKQGLYRSYIHKHDSLHTLRGKLNLQGTIRNRIRRQTQIDCEYDELSVDNNLNQTLKFTAMALIREGSVDKNRRIALRKLMPYFSNVSDITRSDIHWNALSFQRNNKSYCMLMNICYFILEGMLMTTDEGKYKMSTFSDEHMNRIFERFVLNYYKRHHPSLKANADAIKWNIADSSESIGLDLLPSMQSDITLHGAEHTLIIDTKYYSKMMQSQYDKKTLHSMNMYQIFSYVKNRDKNHDGSVSGMLLYAQTSEDVIPKFDSIIDGNRIMVMTLNLNQDFESIKEQLDNIVITILNKKSN